MYRVALVASHPIQYQAPWFRTLSDAIDLEVFFCHRQDGDGQAAAGFGQGFDWDVPLLDGYKHHWLSNISPRPGVDAFGGCDTPEIARRLEAGAFDACVISGWYLKSYLQALRACWRLRLPVLMRGDSHMKRERSRLTSAVKYVPYRWMLNRIDGHLYVGAANRAYLQSFGVPARRLFFAPHFVDNDFFRRGADRARATGEARDLRRAAGAPDDATVFLYVGKLIDNKRPADFIAALAQVARKRRVWGLIVGAGPLEADLERAAAARRAPVTFLGFRNQSALPACYAAADVLVLPSVVESWGLVVNEAMACGVPAIVSQAAGCVEDLIDGVTGLAFPAGDVDALQSAMAAMAAALERHGPGTRAAVCRKVSQYTPHTAAAGLLQALSTIVTRPVAASMEASSTLTR